MLYRFEIMGNQSVQKDLLDLLIKLDVKHYTLLPVVYGMGIHGGRQNDAVWPGANFMMVIYGDEGIEKKLIFASQTIKKELPAEGLKMFKLPGVIEIA